MTQTPTTKQSLDRLLKLSQDWRELPNVTLAQAVEVLEVLRSGKADLVYRDTDARRREQP